MVLGFNKEHLRKIRIASAMTIIIMTSIFIAGCGKEKVIIREAIQGPDPVTLAFPLPDAFVTSNNPTFYWNTLTGAVRYQLQASQTSDFIIRSINIETVDTSYTTINPLANATYYWRVRAINADSAWGDWSDADVRLFYKSDYVSYINLVAQMYTPGVAQDLVVRNGLAYIADGQSDLTIIDVSTPSSPQFVRNLDTRDDDFAQNIFIADVDTFPYVYIADNDKFVQVLMDDDTLFLYQQQLGGNQNTTDAAGIYIDTLLWVFYTSATTGHRALGYAPVYYGPHPQIGATNEITFFTSPYGLFIDGNYIYVAGGEGGLYITDISQVSVDGTITEVSSLDLPGTSLSVYEADDIAYLTCDRFGFQVVDVSDKLNPILLSTVNTSGRTKDVHVVGGYAFVADADGGLKVIDINDPANAFFVAAYATPYAYGVWADQNYIYICDRDYGLMIFENLTQ